jgi:hypothetical protein
MNENERIQAEFTIIDQELKRRFDRNPDLSDTSVSAHLAVMSKPAQDLAKKFHSIAAHGNAEFREPFTPKVPAPDRRDVQKHVAAIHDRYEDEQIIGGIAQRAGTIDANIELNKRNAAQPPSIRDLLEAQP